jgi:ABC-type multidrug transport system fused ATPase/permease subunit
VSSAEPKPTSASPLRILREAFAPYALRLALVAAAALVTALSEVAVLGVLLAAVDTLARGEPYVISGTIPGLGTPYEFTVAQLLWGCAGLTILRTAAQAASIVAAARMTTGYEAARRRRLTAAFLKASWDCQSRERAGQMQSLLTRNIEATSRSMSNLGLAASSGISFGILVTAAFSVDWRCAAIVLVVSAALFVLIRPLSIWARSQSREKLAVLSRFSNSVSQGVGLTKELRVFGVIPYFERHISDLVGGIRRFRSSQVALAGIVPVLHQAASLLILCGGLAAVYAGGFTQLASLSLVVLLLLRALTYGQNLQVFYHAVNEGVPYLQELAEAEAEYDRNAASDGGERLDRIETLEMSGVGYSYTPSTPVLSDVGFAVRRGEIIGIAGPSGSGKSTLMQLLLRLRDPDAGVFSVNGQPVGRYSQQSWFERVSFVPQESVLFDESIAECIRFHRDELDSRAVRRAAEQAGLAADLAAMSEGLETPVGERGGKLSGGQRQRVCIARALAGSPDVIVFDEPTSALDAHSESTVLETLSALRGSVTIFIIAHRLSTLNICDKVMVMRNGRVQSFDKPETVADQDEYFADALRLSRTGASP